MKLFIIFRHEKNAVMDGGWRLAVVAVTANPPPLHATQVLETKLPKLSCESKPKLEYLTF